MIPARIRGRSLDAGRTTRQGPHPPSWILRAGLSAAVLILWELFGRVLEIRSDILPTPSRILLETWKEWPRVLESARITLTEMLSAQIFSCALAVPVIMILSPSIRSSGPGPGKGVLLMKTALIVAAAPLFAAWFGFGPASKILLASLLGLFPLVLRTSMGIRSVSRDLVAIMQLMGAGRRALVLKVFVPACFPAVLAGIRDSAALIVLGVLVGEFVAADGGLGHLLLISGSQARMPLLFSVLSLLSLMVLALHASFAALERSLPRGYRLRSAPVTAPEDSL